MPIPTNTLIPEKYDYNQIAQRLSTLQPSEDIGTRMGKAFADSATGIVQNLVEVGADIHDTVVPEGYESMLNPLAKGIESVKEDIGYRSGIDFQGMQEGLRNDGLSGFWSKFKFEDIPELMAQSFPYMVGAYNAAGFAAISASMAKEMAKNTAVNEGRDPNQTTLSDTLTALPAGMAITALDSLIPNTMTANVMKSIVGRSATTAANRVADRGISTLIKDVATSVVTEGATESVQELIQFAQEHKGVGVFEPEALSQYGVAGLLGGMSGGATDIALKPIHTYQNIKASFTGESTPPIQPSLDSSRLSGITSTEGFSNKPEAEKQEFIDTNFGKITLADGLGRLDIVNGNGSISTLDFNLNPTPDENGNTVYATLTDPVGTKVDITKQGEMINHVYDILQAKIESFDSIDSLTDYVNSIGISNSPLLQSKLLEEIANVNKVKLEAIKASEELGSAKDTINNDNTSNAIKSIHSNTINESNSFTEEQLWKSIGRMVFNSATMDYVDLPSRKKTPVLAEVTAYEQKIRLYKYLQRFLNVNEERTAKILDFIKKQYNMQGIVKNGILSFTNIKETISEPVVENNPSSPSQTTHQTNAPTTTGSDMVNKPREKVQLTTKNKYGEKDQIKSDKANKFIGRGSEKSSTNQYAKDWGNEANTGKYSENDIVFISAEGARNNRIKPDFKEIQKAIDAKATFITDKIVDRNREYNVGEREVAKYLSDNGYKEVSDGTWKNKPREKESTIPEVQNKQETVKSTKQENIPVEKESNESAVHDTTESQSNIDTDIVNYTTGSFASKTNEELQKRQETRQERASKIADRIGVDIQTQTNNLTNAVKALQTSLASIIPSSEQLDRYATSAKYYVNAFANQDFIKVFGLNNKSLFYTTGYLGSLNSIYNNQPMNISMEDDNTNKYYEIMSFDNIDEINNFGGVMFDEVVSSLARTLTKEFGLKPSDRLDDNAYAEIDDNAYKASLFVLQSLIAQGIMEELSVEDIDGNLHRFYKLADSESYNSVSAYAKELGTRDIRTPFSSSNTTNEDRVNVDKTQLRSNGVKISTTIRTAMSKLQQQSYNLNQEMLNDVLLNKELMEDEEFVNNITHYKNPNDVHMNFRDDVKAANDAYKRTLDRLIDYGKEILNDTFWYKYQDNTNARFQPYATVANPVTDKLFARWMVDNANEDSKYSVVKGSNKKTTYYWKNAIVLAMSEAKILNIKADKVDGKTIVDAFDSLADNSTIKEAISFMDSGKKNEAIKLMSKGGLHAIRAFLDYYRYSKLNDNGFMKTSMPTEVDGITNGLAMQLLQIGNGTIADTAKYLNMVGIFLHGGDIKSIYEYRNKGLDDLYTSVANSVSDELKASVANKFFETIEAMGRDVAKPPVMVWLYNAGDMGIQLQVGYSILEKFMNTVNKKGIDDSLIYDLKDYYSNEYYSNNFSSNKITNIKPYLFNRIVDKIVDNKKKLTTEEIFIMQSAFGNTVGALIINSMNKQFEAMSNIKGLFSTVSHYINRTFYQRFQTRGRKVFDNQILLKDASDSGVSTYTMDKELNTDKKYGIYYIGENNRITSMSASPIEKVVQRPFNAEGKPRGDKRGYVVNTHNNDSIAMAKSIIDTISKQEYFGFPVFDAYVGSAGNIDTFVDSYNNNLYDINKSYSVLESLKSALMKAGSYLNNVSYDILMKQLNTAINSNKQLKDIIYSDTGIDKSLIQQMSGVQPYKQYIESKDELGSSREKDMGEFVETKLLQKDTSDFAKLYTDIEENDAVQISDNFNNYLKQIVNNVTKFLGDYQDITKVHMYKGNKNVGKYYKEELTLSLSDTYTFGMSGREVYAHELMHKLTKDAYDNDVKTRNEMNDTFRQFKEYVARNNVNINADTLSYILSRNDANEFIAFVSTNEEVMNAAKDIKIRPNSNLTLFEKVQLFVKTFINNMMRLVRAGIHPELVIHDNLYDRATSIAYELMTVNKKMKSAHKETSFGALFRVTQTINKPIAANITRAINTIKSSSLGNALSNSFNNYGIAYKIANNKYVRILSNEIIERPEAEENQLKLSSYANMVQSNYMQVSNAIASKTNELVSNADTFTRANLKETIIDLDLSSTMINSAEAANYLVNDKARITEIKRIEDYLLSLGTTDKQKNTIRYMINQARGLGYYLATYDAYLNNAQLLNAENITNFNLIKHSSNVEKLNTDMKSLTADIDKLASLYGISYTHKDVRTNAGNYMLRNLENMDKIMEYVLAEVNTSKQQLFNLKGEKHLFIKGYSSTIVDRNYTYTVVPESQLGMYQKHQWKVVSDIKETDRTFGNKQNKMFLMKRVDVDAGYESGILSIQSPTSKGTVLDSIGISSKNSDFKLNVDSYIDRLYSKDDMSTGQMIPLFSPNTKDGISIANYRYSMTKNNKKDYLAMKSDISNVLAETKSMTDRKIHENELNEAIVKTLIDDFINHKDATEFVEVGADTEYRDQWNMLPRHTRRYIVSQLGTNSIYVRKQMLNEYFGYKNLDLSTLLHLKKEYYPLQLLEKIWRDAVKIVRNSIVLKTLSTIFNNEMSNIRTLMTEMPIDKAFKYVAEGWQATDSYRADHKRLLQIEQMIASKKPYDRNEYNRLKKAIAINPVKDLFDAGKFEAVVDDTNLERHEVNNIVERYVDRAVNKLPPKLRSIVNTIYLGEDTVIFKSLARFVLYSDFTARYALYKNAIDKGLSKEEALSDGDKYFIRYSVLQDKHLKYVGDIGLFMFSKYLLRIQKGIYRMLKKNPTAVLQQGLAEHMIGKSSDILDSGLWSINLGRFNTFGSSLTELGDPHLLTELHIL